MILEFERIYSFNKFLTLIINISTIYSNTLDSNKLLAEEVSRNKNQLIAD